MAMSDSMLPTARSSSHLHFLLLLTTAHGTIIMHTNRHVNVKVIKVYSQTHKTDINYSNCVFLSVLASTMLPWMPASVATIVLYYIRYFLYFVDFTFSPFLLRFSVALGILLLLLFFISLYFLFDFAFSPSIQEAFEIESNFTSK